MVRVGLCRFIDFILYLHRVVFLPEIFIFNTVQSRAAFKFSYMSRLQQLCSIYVFRFTCLGFTSVQSWQCYVA